MRHRGISFHQHLHLACSSQWKSRTVVSSKIESTCSRTQHHVNPCKHLPSTMGCSRVSTGGWPRVPKSVLNTILRFSASPGASCYHWGTEVDFNSANVTDWRRRQRRKVEGAFFKLCCGSMRTRLKLKAGFIQAYTAGRSGGYNEEPCTTPACRFSSALRQRYGNQINLQTNVIYQIDSEFQKRTKANGQTVPSDFKTELQNINIADLSIRSARGCKIVLFINARARTFYHRSCF